MQKQTPLISVIMPLYNAERFVGESIENVLRQTVGDFELIVIDDASTDASAEIARAYAAKDNRIVLMHNELNSGAARTRNRALDAARGKWMRTTSALRNASPNSSPSSNDTRKPTSAAVTTRCSAQGGGKMTN